MSPFRPGLYAAVALTCACGMTGPASGAAVYALHRIGDAVLPVPLTPPAPYPRLVADTLILPEGRSREDALTVEVRNVIEQSATRADRSTVRYRATVKGDLLVVDSCPINAACIASLVYAPITYAFVGDSLIQQVAPGSSQKPAVYGRVFPR